MNATHETRISRLTWLVLVSALWALKDVVGSGTSSPAHAADKIRPASGSKVAVRAQEGPNDGNFVSYPSQSQVVDLARQTVEMAAANSRGCLSCHKDACDPHQQPDRPLSIQLGCVDCHGGNANAQTKQEAHIQPRYPEIWQTSANPVRTYTLLNHECAEFIRFINPGDLRIAHLSCGTVNCHPRQTLEVRKSMMTHGCMLWGAALYNNGAVPNKWSRYGESYSMDGTPQRLQTVPAPTADEMSRKGILPFLDPLPRFENSHPGNVLRIFERGGRFAPEVGIPETLDLNGKPRQRLSNRGLGTLNRTDPVFIGLQKTRLLDPTLNFLGTNDQAGDYRSSGCTSCHMIYANDRSPVNSGPWAKYGNGGLASAVADKLVNRVDPTIPKDEPGHPVTHRFVTGVPTSQCIVCHIHPGTTVMNSFLGYMWWDQESDAEFMYPANERKLTSEEIGQAQMNDPNEITARSHLSDPNFLKGLSEMNPTLRKSHFADFHGHGWAFKAVFKKDRYGHHLDHFGNRIPEPNAQQRQAAIDITMESRNVHRHRNERTLQEVQELEAKLRQNQNGIPVHLLDIHLEKGMHCVDCHFVQDVHGNTKLYGEVRAAIEIRCEDCHGSVERRAIQVVNGIPKMNTSGPAAAEQPGRPVQGRDLTNMRTPFGKRRFEVRDNRVIQNSMVESDLSWEVKQVLDTITPTHKDYNAMSALAKTARFSRTTGELEWGDVPSDRNECAHSTTKLNCIACHSSWNPSCYGCHLPQKANKKAPALHNEGDITRNFVSYNFQTLREDIFMLAHDGNVTGNRIGPARSSCAIHVTSYNQNRESIYTQQQTISAEGHSGIAFSTNVPHTVRGRGETKSCSECHLTPANDNNAQMAQLLMHGTNFMNFIGRYCWVGAGEHGIHGVTVSERDEPQTVIGSTLHQVVYPTRYRKHCSNDGQLDAWRHPGKDIGDTLRNPLAKPEILSLLARGEYLYAACGKGGIRVFDIAFIDNKGFSQRFSTAPVSPLGQKFYVKSKYATSVTAPTTIAPDPTRTHLPENHETPVHPVYAYIYATDLYDGLILVGAGTLLDGDPTNNFLEAALVYNPNGQLNGARAVTIVGKYAYVSCTAGLVVVDLGDDPLHPCIVHTIGSDDLQDPSAVQVQFRYGFVCDKQGLKVLNVTDPAHPHLAAVYPLRDARNVYVARNYAYVAGGCDGLIMIDVTNPESPVEYRRFDANGQMNDVNDVKLGAYYASQFAFVADGRNGMRVLQLTSPETPGYDAFLPQPVPNLIATYPIPHGGCALTISEGVDRDRAVDESGNQIAVFGRVGGRPLSLAEQRRMYMKPDGATLYSIPEVRRNEEIADPRQREAELHFTLERTFSRSKHSSFQKRNDQ